MSLDSSRESIDRSTVRLENRLGRVPTQGELAEDMQISPTDLLAALEDVSGTTLLSLDELVYREEDNRQVPRVETLESPKNESILGDIERQDRGEPHGDGGDDAGEDESHGPHCSTTVPCWSV